MSLRLTRPPWPAETKHLQNTEMFIMFLLPIPILNALLTIYWSSDTLLRNLLDDFMKITQFKVIEYYSFFWKARELPCLLGNMYQLWQILKSYFISILAFEVLPLHEI